MAEPRKRVLMNTRQIAVFLPEVDAPFTQLHSKNLTLNKFLIENRGSLTEKIQSFDHKLEVTSVAKYGNTDDIQRFNTNLDSLMRKITLFSAECEINDFKIAGATSAPP